MIPAPNTPRMPSRRAFARGAAAGFATALLRVKPAAGAPAHRLGLAYVATYSSPAGPEGSKGRGQGIYLFAMDPDTGALEQHAVIPNGSNPSWLAIDPKGAFLYSANETAVFEGMNSGSISAYRIDRAGGQLTLINTVSSEGAGPCYVSVHPGGKHVLVANYAGGTVAVAAIGANGGLLRATCVIKDEGSNGPQNSTSAPPGSYAISGHESPHAHMIQADPTGRFVLASDLGLDRITVWKFDAEHGRLVEPAHFPLPPGDGPRHFTFHPNGRWLYSLQEEASTLALWEFDSSTGKLNARQSLSSLPKDFAGTDFTSEVAVSPDGKFVYAANRLHNSISFFSIAADGRLAFVGEEWTRGDYPRSFTIDPSGRFLYCSNQRSDAITTFLVDRESGGLKFTGRYTPVGTPAMLAFLP
jgi:6-phosphogluconolactonase